MNTQLLNYIRAGYPGIYICSCEEPRVEAELKAVTQSIHYGLFMWTANDGLINTADGHTTAAPDPLEMLGQTESLPKQSVILLKDFHLFIQDGDAQLFGRLKDVLRVAKTKGKPLVVLACRAALPPELEREFVILHLPLPDKAQLAVVLDNIALSANLSPIEGDERERILDAACGLTCSEAENAFSLSVVECGSLCGSIIAREKAREVQKSGLLEICTSVASLNDVGGLDLLKNWLLQRKDAFGREAQAYQLPPPKGLLIVGVSGTGKSLTAKATARVFDRPLLKLDAGRLFGSLVGQSESNLRSVIATCEAIAPCVLWIDELEKGFSGARGSGAADGGTTTRVLGSFLSWLQERKSPVFVVATANDVAQLPPELLRKGRFDELFFVDLPNQEEREAIWRIQIARYGRLADKFDVMQFAKATDGFTGAEIEQLFVDGLHEAFSRREEPTDLSIAMLLASTIPLSKLMGEEINSLRRWAQGRARPAAVRDSSHGGRRMIAG